MPLTTSLMLLSLFNFS